MKFQYHHNFHQGNPHIVVNITHFFISVRFLLFVRKVAVVKSLSWDCLFHWLSFEHLAEKNISWTLEIPNFFQLIERWWGKVILTFSISESPYMDISTFTRFKIFWTSLADLTDTLGIESTATIASSMAFFIAAPTLSIGPLPWSISVKIRQTSILLLSAIFLAKKAQPAFLYWLDVLSVIGYKFSSLSTSRLITSIIDVKDAHAAVFLWLVLSEKIQYR